MLLSVKFRPFYFEIFIYDNVDIDKINWHANIFIAIDLIMFLCKHI